MKTMLTAATALLLAGGLSAGTAYAAGATAGSQPAATGQASDATAPSDQAGHPLKMRQQIEAQLSRDGYTNVTVMPSSFFVHAKNKAGDPVAMVIGPDSFTEVTDLNPKQAQTATASPAAPASKTTQQ